MKENFITHENTTNQEFIVVVSNLEYDSLLSIRVKPSVEVKFKDKVVDIGFFVDELLHVYPLVMDLIVQHQAEKAEKLLMNIDFPEIDKNPRTTNP